MKKWIVGLLLLANVALFGWMRWGSALTVDPNAVLAQAALNPDKVKLLEFLPASAVAPASSVAERAPLPLSSVPASAPSVATATATVPAIAASAPQRIPLAPLPRSAPAATVEVASASAVSAEPVKVVPQKLSSCAEWGEFSGSDLKRAKEALATLKLGDDLSQRQMEQTHGYWVYLPPQKNRARVEKKISQLKARGVEDYFVVQEKGQWLNAISLGVFRSEEAAQRYLATLRTKGVRTAKVGERKSRLRYTIFLVKGLDSGTTDKLNALQKDFPDSELKVSACED